MKKITIITRQVKKVGGIEKFIATLSKVLSVELVVNYGKPSEKPAFELSSKIEVKYLSPIEPDEISLKDLIMKKRFDRILAEFPRRRMINSEQKKAFRSLLSVLETDVIITDRADYNFLVKRFYRGMARRIATDHNFHQNDQKYIQRLMNSVDGFDSLVVMSDELVDFYKDKTATKVLCIPPALEKIPEKKSKLDTKNLISVGRFVPEKDFSMLVDVMKIVNERDPDIRLSLIGDGPELEMVKERVKEDRLEKVISLLGFLGQEEVSRHYLNSSLFVMTSKTEAFGFVLAEAMSYGLPCVAFSRASGARAQITEQTGVLIQETDAEKMASEIVSLINDDQRMVKMQKRINQNITVYSAEKFAESWRTLID